MYIDVCSGEVTVLCVCMWCCYWKYIVIFLQIHFITNILFETQLKLVDNLKFFGVIRPRSAFHRFLSVVEGKRKGVVPRCFFLVLLGLEFRIKILT